MSCHGPSAPPSGSAVSGGTAGAATLTDSLRVLLVGAPNVGKSTLFNALTGARQRTTNAPGTTVELATGTWRSASGTRESSLERTIVDLPGTYSLLARSADEQVSADAVRELAQSSGEYAGQRGAAVVVLDATALTRSLYLLAQVAETGVPLVVALTMLDLAEAATDSPTAVVAPDALAATLVAVLGVPVIPVDARNRTGDGLRDLARAVDDVAANPKSVLGIAPLASSCGCEKTGGCGGATSDSATLDDPTLNGKTPGLAQELAHAETLFAWVEHVVERVGASISPAPGADAPGTSGRPPHRTFSDRVDTVLLNPWAGIPVFLAVVWLLFELTTTFAPFRQPPSNARQATQHSESVHRWDHERSGPRILNANQAWAIQTKQPAPSLNAPNSRNGGRRVAVHGSLPQRQLNLVEALDLQAAELFDGLNRLDPQCLRDDVIDGPTICIPQLHGDLRIGQACSPELDGSGTSLAAARARLRC